MKIHYSFLLLFVLLFGCQPTVENETKAFNRNQQRIIQLSQKFPVFKTYLTKLGEDATKIFDESKPLAEEKDQAQKMREANRYIYNDKLFTQLQTYESYVERVERKRENLLKVSDQKYRSRIQSAIDRSREKINTAYNLMTYSSPLNYNDAVLKAEKASGLLTEAEKIVDDVIEYISNAEKTPVTENPRADDSQEGGRATEEPYAGGRQQTATEEPYEGGRN